MRITEPGVYDIPAELYHADPVEGGSLSSSGARLLLRECPEMFDYQRRHPSPPSGAMEFGTAAHTMVLGVGAPIERVDADSWRTKAAKEQAAKAREAGAVPLLAEDADRVHAMAARLRAHPVASALFSSHSRPGRPEQALVWRDTDTGVMCRALLDWLPEAAPSDGHMIVADYKTCRSAKPSAVAKSAAEYGYAAQAAYYIDGLIALGLAEQVSFLLVAQQKTPPYPITIAQFSAFDLEQARRANRRALEIFRDCQASGAWPSHTPDDEIPVLELPAWAHKALEEA